MTPNPGDFFLILKMALSARGDFSSQKNKGPFETKH